MTRGLRLRRGAGAAAALAGLFVLTPWAPAGADPVITVANPAEGSTVASATVPVSGRVEATAGPLLGSFKVVTLNVAGVTFRVPCSSSPCDFTWNPLLISNGRYELTVTATEQTLVLDGATASLTRRFVVDAPPAKPALDPPKVNDARTVDLTWSRNTEPDMLYYEVFRKDPAGATYLPVGRVDQPASVKPVSFTDTTTNLNGGDYGYQVVAVRKGGAKAETASTPSAARTATVPAPPPTTTAVTVPGAAAGRGSTTTVKPGAAAGVDLSGFLSSRAQPAPATPPTVLEPPDPGFQGTLPFSATAPTDQVEEGDAQAIAPSTGRSTSVVGLDRARPLVPVAAGLVLLLLATHLRLVNRRLKPAPAGDLPVDAAAPTPAPAVVDTAEPGPPEVKVAHGAAATFYDADDDGWAGEWAPPGPGDAEPVVHAGQGPDAEIGRQRALGLEPQGLLPDAGLLAAPHPDAAADVEIEPDFEIEPDVEIETRFEPVSPLGPADAFESRHAFDPQARPGPESQPDPEAEFELEPVVEAVVEPAPAVPEVDLDELEENFEVMEVISPARRPLARSGHW